MARTPVGQYELKKFKQCFKQIDLEYVSTSASRWRSLLLQRELVRASMTSHTVVCCRGTCSCSASGVIDYDEFFEFIDETKTPFSEGLFRMIDADSNGTVRMHCCKEYALAERCTDGSTLVCVVCLFRSTMKSSCTPWCSTACTRVTRSSSVRQTPSIAMVDRCCLPTACADSTGLVLYAPTVAFDTFDPAKTGAIGEKEFKRLISVVNDGKPVYPGNFKNALAEFDRCGAQHDTTLAVLVPSPSNRHGCVACSHGVTQEQRRSARL